MKKLIAATMLCFGSMGAQAADYVLTDIVSTNIFGSASFCDLAEYGRECGGTATVNGDAVTTSGIQFDFENANSNFDYRDGEWSTTIGGNAVIKIAETCTVPAGVDGCVGLLGDWETGTPDPLDAVEVTLVGTTLTIIDSSPFATTGLPSSNTFTFEEVAIPVPAAVWLFGSALGMLGWIRRRTVA